MPDQPALGRILTIQDIEHHHWRRSESEVPVGLSAAHTQLSLSAAVELACIEFTGSHSQLADPKTRLPNCPIWKLIKSAEWGSRRTRGRFKDGSLAVFVLPQDANDAWWTQSLHELIRELEANAFPAHLARALTGAVAEMVDNIWIHSESPRAGLLAYQLRRRKFAFSVADIGVGVLATLRKNHRYRALNSSMEAIRMAIQPGVSQFEGGGGLGFPSLLNALADLWGTVRLRSGEAALVIDRRSEERAKSFVYLPYLQGVHVAVRCALDRPRRTGTLP
jgi:anti-sigma regulatory factor (Ser/Thr protein kinase)